MKPSSTDKIWTKNGEPLRALVIHEPTVMRGVVLYLLAKWGFEVRDLPDNQTAWRYLAAGALPDLIVVDWKSPEMRAQEFVRQLRADPKLASIKIIAMTADPEEEAAQSAVESGIDDWIITPCQAKAIKATVAGLFGIATE